MTQLPEIKMQGRSGCRLEVMKSGEHVIIKKHSSSIAYNRRLIKQAQKQLDFYNSMPPEPRFSTANVIDIYPSNDSLASFTMPYLFSEKYSDHFEKLSISELKVLLNDLLYYLLNNIKDSSFEVVNQSIILAKVDELKVNIRTNAKMGDATFIDEVMKYLEFNTPGEPLPIGKCHGDLTFSNILFGDHKIYLLDFLDSFIESPIIDIVKLRQDTCFKWSVMLERDMPAPKKNKIIQTFDYLDHEIASFCDNELGMGHWYNYLQVFNLMRIFPYLDREDEISFIEKSLRQIIK